MNTRKVLIAHNIAAAAALVVILVGSISTGIIWWVWTAMGLILVATVGINVAYFRTR
ncbi:hypothetical protein Q7689_10270 [Nocardiopsis tropica]|uniref:hypothetical protein n=1 Tax=Nocardiopsis tropica TaxID=109330 RepID=UPI002E88BAA7|nr:hypothetical protein [Nocardiopsis tropica]